MAGYLGSRPVVVQVDGYQREESESRYVNVSGDDFSGHLDFVDDAKARFGSSDELHIYTESSGSGHSYIQGDNIVIRSAAGTARLTVTSNDVDVSSGALKVGGTTVIDSSRNANLTKVRTAGSTAAGRMLHNNGYATFDQMESTGSAFVGYGLKAGGGSANEIVSATSVGVGRAGVFVGTLSGGTIPNIQFVLAPGQTTADGSAPTGLVTPLTISTSSVKLDTDLKMGNTTVIDSSRAITAASATFAGTGRKVLLGDYTSTSSGSPTSLSLGARHSDTAGESSSLKLQIWENLLDNTATNYLAMGLGVSSNQLDYVVTDSTYKHAFWIGGTKRVEFNSSQLNLDSKTVITSTASPALQVNSSADSARAIVANTIGTSTFTYLELSTSSYGVGYLIKNIANSGNGLNNGSLYLWNSDNGGSGAIEFVPNQTIANRTTVEENGDLSVRGKVAILTTANDGLHIGSTASDYSGYGTGVPTISLQGTNNANRRAGAISFKEGDGTVTGAIYSTYGGDGYAGLNFHSKTEAIKFAVGGSSSSPADDIVTIEGGSNKSRLNVNYLANVYNGGLGGVYAYNGFIGANEISASGSDNDANVRVRVCINTSTSVWRAGYCWVTASSCGTGGQGPVTAWWLYRFRTYNSSLGGVSVADSGGDTSSFSVAFSDDGDPDGDGTSLVIGVRVASTHSTANDETTMGIVLGTREGPPRAAERISS